MESIKYCWAGVEGNRLHSSLYQSRFVQSPKVITNVVKDSEKLNHLVKTFTQNEKLNSCNEGASYTNIPEGFIQSIQEPPTKIDTISMHRKKKHCRTIINNNEQVDEIESRLGRHRTEHFGLIIMKQRQKQSKRSDDLSRPLNSERSFYTHISGPTTDSFVGASMGSSPKTYSARKSEPNTEPKGRCMTIASIYNLQPMSERGARRSGSFARGYWAADGSRSRWVNSLSEEQILELIQSTPADPAFPSLGSSLRNQSITDPDLTESCCDFSKSYGLSNHQNNCEKARPKDSLHLTHYPDQPLNDPAMFRFRVLDDGEKLNKIYEQKLQTNKQIKQQRKPEKQLQRQQYVAQPPQQTLNREKHPQRTGQNGVTNIGKGQTNGDGKYHTHKEIKNNEHRNQLPSVIKSDAKSTNIQNVNGVRGISFNKVNCRSPDKSGFYKCNNRMSVQSRDRKDIKDSTGKRFTGYGQYPVNRGTLDGFNRSKLRDDDDESDVILRTPINSAASYSDEDFKVSEYSRELKKGHEQRLTGQDQKTNLPNGGHSQKVVNSSSEELVKGHESYRGHLNSGELAQNMSAEGHENSGGENQNPAKTRNGKIARNLNTRRNGRVDELYVLEYDSNRINLNNLNQYCSDKDYIAGGKSKDSQQNEIVSKACKREKIVVNDLKKSSFSVTGNATIAALHKAIPGERLERYMQKQGTQIGEDKLKNFSRKKVEESTPFTCILKYDAEIPTKVNNDSIVLNNNNRDMQQIKIEPPVTSTKLRKISVHIPC